jgi:ABC-type transport system involved in multi-copper enzyme maturation permease subunit
MVEIDQNGQSDVKSSFIRPFNVIFRITFDQTIKSKKTIFMLLVTFLPVFLTLYYRIAQTELFVPPPLVLVHVMMFYLLFVSILVALFYGNAMIGDEVDNRTIIYYFTRPIPKYTIMIGKFVAYIASVFLIIIPPMLISFLIIASDRDMSRDFAITVDIFARQLGVVLLGLIVYGSIFMFFGTSLKHPIISGLLLAFGWEKIMLVVPGLIRKFSVAHYLISAFPTDLSMRSAIDEVSKGANSSPTASIITIIIITIVFLGLSIYTIYNKEYKFE